MYVNRLFNNLILGIQFVTVLTLKFNLQTTGKDIIRNIMSIYW